jgi:hypothetical protein
VSRVATITRQNHIGTAVMSGCGSGFGLQRKWAWVTDSHGGWYGGHCQGGPARGLSACSNVDIGRSTFSPFCHCRSLNQR